MDGNHKYFLFGSKRVNVGKKIDCVGSFNGVIRNIVCFRYNTFDFTYTLMFLVTCFLKIYEAIKVH